MEVESLLQTATITKGIPDNTSVDRDELLVRYRTVRQMTEWICEPLAVEDCVVQSAMECSPVKWQLAHTSWFFETLILKAHDPKFKEFHPAYGFLFNSYYNAVGDRTPRPERGLMSRPTLAEVMEYRTFIDRAMNRFIGETSLALFYAALPTIVLGLNHEQQHQELIITDVKTVLAMNPLRPVYRDREIGRSIVKPMQWVSFDETLSEIGTNGPGFFFDNEGPGHRYFLESFHIADRLITNGEYKEFIADGGYETPTPWLSDGWAMCLEKKWKAPKYWDERDGADYRSHEWWNMTLQGFRPVEDSEPVTHISHYEADAFATWYGARLATEFEWEHVSLWPTATAQSSGVEGNFLDNGNFHPAAAKPSNGLQQMFGDAWEWTRSAYLPYPGYHPQAGAIGEYNGKFMSNQMVLRGGSCATPRDHIRATYRNFFPPESRWQFTGIRLAK